MTREMPGVSSGTIAWSAMFFCGCVGRLRVCAALLERGDYAEITFRPTWLPYLACSGTLSRALIINGIKTDRQLFARFLRPCLAWTAFILDSFNFP